jgi:hypothetical protein
VVQLRFRQKDIGIPEDEHQLAIFRNGLEDGAKIHGLILPTNCNISGRTYAFSAANYIVRNIWMGYVGLKE